MREAAAKAASGLSGTAEGREILIESKLDPIEKLVPMMDEAKLSISTLALAAIVNREDFPTTITSTHLRIRSSPATGSGSVPMRFPLLMHSSCAVCEYENAARGVVVKAGAMPKAMERVVLGFEAIKEGRGEVTTELVHGSKLLANLTRHHDGRQAAVGFLSDGSQAARGLQVGPFVFFLSVKSSRIFATRRVDECTAAT